MRNKHGGPIDRLLENADLGIKSINGGRKAQLGFPITLTWESACRI